ncbi:MAG: VacJ family lipoprotein [Rhodospirillaceae bacterium]
MARAEFEQINDPMEPANRYFFELNRFLDFLLIHPWADTYRRIVPDFGRERVHNALQNVGSPMDVVNQALQGRGTDSATTLGRFVVNSTAGVGGLFDVATGWGLPASSADFGQTLHVWGAPEGPYMVMPILGPSNPRDAVGFGVDNFADPMGWVFKLNSLNEVNTGLTVGNAIDKRAEYIEPMEALEKSSIDFYAQVRSMFRQHRAKELGIEASGSSTPSYDFYSEPVAEPKAKTKAK